VQISVNTKFSIWTFVTNDPLFPPPGGNDPARGARDSRRGATKEDKAKEEAEKPRPGLTMFTDGSRLEDGATGYAVVWKNGRPGWASRPTWATTRKPTMRSALLSPAVERIPISDEDRSER